MFKVLLDLHMHFVPPMTEHGPGVVFTREIRLPFAPVEGTRIFSAAFDDCRDPEGIVLKDVIWDIDRETFLASAYMSHHDLPIRVVPDLLREWIAYGWRLGSFRDSYGDATDDDQAEGVGSSTAEQPAADIDEADDDNARVLGLTWRGRSAAMNRILRAFVRHIAEGRVCDHLAYALDRTGRYFEESDARDRAAQDPHVAEFSRASAEFLKLPFEQQERWRDKTRRYPTFEDLVS